MEHWLLSDKNLTGLLRFMAKLIFGHVNSYFLLTHCRKKIEITDLKRILAGENTSVLIILAPLYAYIFLAKRFWSIIQYSHPVREHRIQEMSLSLVSGCKKVSLLQGENGWKGSMIISTSNHDNVYLVTAIFYTNKIYCLLDSIG